MEFSKARDPLSPAGSATRPILLAAGSLALWLALQVAFRNAFIFHDSWKHVFPMLFNVSRQATCGGLPGWLGTVDSGSPLIVYATSLSLTQILRLPALFLMGCLGLDLVTSLYLYKAAIVLSYLGLAGGMFVLGCVLYRRRLSAVYLLVATLFAGFYLDALHSSQIIAEIFWMPWLVAAAVLFHSQPEEPPGVRYLNAAIFFACLQLLEHYVHIAVLAIAVGAALYAVLWPGKVRVLLGSPLVRLWPAAVIGLVTVFQLWALRETISGYRPSVGRDLVVELKTFGETGFVQPTALIASFLPLGFLAGFDGLSDSMMQRLTEHRWLRYPLTWAGGVSRAFIFRLDALIFYLGFIPIVLLAAFVLARGAPRRRTWWLLFALIMFLVSLQQSGLYLLLYHLPFFNVFRIYFMFVVMVVFAGLVMSGYGLDAYLAMEETARRRLLLRSLLVVLSLTLLAGLSIRGLLQQDVPADVVSRTLQYLRVDGLIVAAGLVVVWLCGWSRRPERAALGLIAVLAVCQTVYFVGTLNLVGVSSGEVLKRYELEEDDKRPLPALVESDPNLFRRKECVVFAQCYVSQRDTVSLRRNLEGTFLRGKEEPVFQEGLSPSVVRALSGLTHPVFWLSQRAVTYEDRRMLAERLNTHAERIGDHLREVTYVARADMGNMGGADWGSGRHRLVALARGRDVVRLTYEAETPVILNASINYEPYWVARVDGRQAAVVRGNFNGLATLLPPGRRTVELSYRSWVSDLFFYTRYLSLSAALFVAGWVTRSALRISKTPVSAGTTRSA